MAWRLSRSALILVAMTSTAASSAGADDVAEFYGKAGLRVMIGNPAGPGYDTYGRILAKHITKHLPGLSNVTVVNRPGAGSLTLMNELYNTAPRDGSVIGLVNRNVLTEPLFGNELARYDAQRFNWIGSLNNEVSICGAWRTTGIKSFLDLKTRGMITGGSGATDDTVVFAHVLNNLLGTKLKVVSGYSGAAQINLAVERGELEGRCGMSYSQLASAQRGWLTEGLFTVVLQLSTTAHPDLKGVPLVTEVANPDSVESLRLIFARQYWGRPVAAPPGVPPQRVAALRKAFMAAMRDPQLREEADKMPLEINPIDGEAISKELARVFQSPREVVEAARRAMKSQ